METTTLAEVYESVITVKLPDELYLALGFITACLIMIMFSFFYNR